uniref:Uncharacterized protein n=1 Tax=Anser cygnoides TaxID=8845 RepID=A0A8B9DHA3_ANSCY
PSLLPAAGRSGAEARSQLLEEGAGRSPGRMRPARLNWGTSIAPHSLPICVSVRWNGAMLGLRLLRGNPRASHGSEPLAGLPGWPPARLPCQSYPGQPCPMPHWPGTHRAGRGMDGLDPIHGAERLQDGAGALFLARRGGWCPPCPLPAP